MHTVLLMVLFPDQPLHDLLKTVSLDDIHAEIRGLSIRAAALEARRIEQEKTIGQEKVKKANERLPKDPHKAALIERAMS